MWATRSSSPPTTTSKTEEKEEKPVHHDNDGSSLSSLSDDDSGEEGSTDDEGGDAWESESLLEDFLESTRPECFDPEQAGEDCATPEESKELRSLLKSSGEEAFLMEAVNKRGISIRKCLSAFNVRPPPFFEDAPDRALLPLLQVVLGREMMRRTRLPHVSTVDHVVDLLKKSKNIIVLTGAGISTSLGIPDFRSKGSGLYSRLESLGLSDPQEVFDIDVFNDDPTIFYQVAKDILPTTKTFSPTHAFIALLQNKDKLLTQYTQNIDNLEMLAGIKEDKLVQCHGSFAYATCVKCKHRVPGDTIFPELRRGVVAKCDKCLQHLAESSAAGKKRKRAKNSEHWRKKRYSEDSSAEEEEVNFREAGVMKPDITFFGEQLPDTFHKRLVSHDREKADLLICIGTSLKVAPVSEIIGFLPSEVPQIYISKTPVNHVDFDVELLGPCDDVVVELCRRAGWNLVHEMIPATRPTVEWKRVDGPGNRYEFVVEKGERIEVKAQ